MTLATDADFPDCGALLARLRSGVLTHATAKGLDPFDIPIEGFDPNSDFYATPGLPESGAKPLDGITVAEEGVAEPATATLAGERVVAIRGRALEIYDLAPRTPARLGRLDLQARGMDAQTVVVAGSRALVGGYEIPQGGHSKGGPIPDSSVWRAPKQDPVMLALVDLTDPAQPRLMSTQRVDAGGTNVLRLTGSTARFVTSRFPSLELRTPKSGRGKDPGAATSNVDTVQNAPLQTWLGRRQVVDGTTGLPLLDSRVADCTQVHDTPEAGPAITTVQTIDLTRDDALQAADSVAFVGGAGAYVSPDRVYLANPPNSERPTTVLHALGARADPMTPVEGTAAIRGYLREAGAMSERNGMLRVLLNDRPTPKIPSDGTQRDTPGDARIVVLDTALDEIGQVAGVAGGSAAARVRWLGDLAAVGSDHRLHPLHVVDLSDSRRPSLGGLLRTEGRYTYLYSASEGTVVGLGTSAHKVVGEDATVPFQGFQLSVLDLTHPDQPTRRNRLDFGLGRADLGYLSHAFTYSPERRIATFPSFLDAGNSCPGDEYCLSGGDVIPDRCRTDVAGCSQFTAPAEIPGVTAVRIAADGSVIQTGRWTGGEVTDVLALDENRLVILTFDAISVVDLETLRPIAAARFGDAAPGA